MKLFHYYIVGQYFINCNTICEFMVLNIPIYIIEVNLLSNINSPEPTQAPSTQQDEAGIGPKTQLCAEEVIFN